MTHVTYIKLLICICLVMFCVGADSGYSSLELPPSITPVEVMSIIGTDTQPLVIDIRSESHFNGSSIKHDSLDLINLPAEHIQGG